MRGRVPLAAVLGGLGLLALGLYQLRYQGRGAADRCLRAPWPRACRALASLGEAAPAPRASAPRSLDDCGREASWVVPTDHQLACALLYRRRACELGSPEPCRELRELRAQLAPLLCAELP